MRKNNKMERQLDDIRVLVAEAKIRNNFNDDELALYIGLSKASLADEKVTQDDLLSISYM